MTYNVLTIMAKASLSGQREAGEKEKFMQIKALRYIDQELIKNFTAQDTTLTHNRLLYLYTRSFIRIFLWEMPFPFINHF